MNNLYIVAKGKCKIVYEIVDKDLFYAPKFQKKLKPFKFQEYRSNTSDIVPVNEQNLEREKILTELRQSSTARTFNNEAFKLPGEQDANTYRRHVNDLITNNNLDLFQRDWSRCLFWYQVYEECRR
jgi:hypothetical protein